MIETKNNPASETAESEMSERPSVARNVTSSVAARVGYMITRVFIPPFVLAHVGLEAYGIWATAFILVSYLGLSTLGISNVYVRNIAGFQARREYHKANELLSTGLMITLPLAAVLFFLVYWQWPLVAHLMNIPPHLNAESREAILLVVAVFLSSLSLNAFNDVLTGTQLITESVRIWVVGYLLETALIYALVGMGRGIRGLAEAFFVRIALTLVLSAICAFRLLPWLRVSPKYFSRVAMRQLAQFGGLFQIQSLLSVTLSSAERIAGAYFVGPEAAGLLDVAKKWPNSISAIPMSFLSAFMPAASHIHASTEEQNKMPAIREFYMKGSRYMNLSAAYFCGFLALFAGPIMQVWLHKPLDHAVLMFVIFTVAMQIHLMTGPGTSILRGTGHVYEEFYYVVPNVALLLVFIPASRWIMGNWNVVGVGWGVCLATFIGAFIFLVRAHIVMSVGLREFTKEVLVPSLVPYAIATVLALPMTPLIASVNRWVGAGLLVVSGAVYTIALFLILQFVFFRQEERLRCYQMLSRFLGADLSARLSRVANV